jgi:cyclopropane-fatty-acyl-phospholipid synthase
MTQTTTGMTSTGEQPALDTAAVHSKRIMAALFGSPAERPFDVAYWDGTTERGRSTAPFSLRVNRPGGLRRMLFPPSELSIVEAFLSGDIDVDGDLEAAATLGDAINARVRSPRTIAAIARHVMALPRSDAVAVRRTSSGKTGSRTEKRHEASRDRAAIQYHYDVGNDFYALWLDKRMVYSCAYFHAPGDALDDAQVAKLDLTCRKLRLQPGEYLLDVGCGWGALIMHAAQHYGVRALGITLSNEQATLARSRIQAAGLSDRCTVEIRDYRDLPTVPTFDKIASIGMVEHVGVGNLPVYFQSLHRALAPAGLLLNHGIVNIAASKPLTWAGRLEAWAWRRDAFIDQYVFPDGKLGPLSAVIGAAEAAGFETRDVEGLRPHYLLTLRAWVARLTRNARRIVAITDERTYRTWRLYMAAAAHGFATGRLNVVQTLLAKPDASGTVGLPLTRADLLGNGGG